MIAKFFIERPVLSNVIALLIVILGLVSLLNLPVAHYPNVVPPTVQVTTRYPGASPSTVIRDVALPIEQKVNGVEGMIYMSSMSTSDGQYTLTVTFKIGTDADKAQILVQNRVATALPTLPQAVQTQGVQTNKKSTSILEIVSLSSPGDEFDGLYLSNFATINLLDQISRLDGVGSVSIFGAGQYAMRIWLDPQKLEARKLSPSDVIKAVNLQSRSTVAGQVGIPPVPPGQAFQYTINVPSNLDDAAEFENIIVKAEQTNGGSITRLKDVARIELGAQQYSQTFKLDGHPSAGLSVFQLPEANALDVAKRVEAKMRELAPSFPPGIKWTIPFNTTKFVAVAIHDVYKTLIEAALLVLIVILVFLQDWRATLVPATTVPVTIIGAFAAIAAFGFTINLSTLFAIILAIGIVVDDAIIVVEGAAKFIDEGMTPHDAAIKAMDQLLGPIIGITLVLMAVFVPAAFLPGLSGQMYRQFAMVIAATALISAVNALTLKPTQCALWLRPSTPPEERNFFYRGFNRAYNAAENWYARLIAFMVKRAALMSSVVAALVVLSVYALSLVPTAFMPIEDQGYFVVAVQLPDGASLERTTRALDDVTRRAKMQPGVEQVVAISGIAALNDNASLSNAGVAYVILKDWSERGKGEDLRGLYAALSERMKVLPDGVALVVPPPPIQGVGNSAGSTMKVQLRNGSFDYAELQKLANAISRRAAQQSMFAFARNYFSASAPQLDVTFDRVKTETLGVPLGSALDALSSYMGSSYVGQFNRFGRVFQIYVQAEASARVNEESLKTLQVRNNSGDMVPFGTLANIKTVAGPPLISLFNLYPAATIITGTATGYSSGQGLSVLEQIAADTLPAGAGFEWTEMSFQEKQVGNQIYWIYALSLLLVYLVLAGQYESWIAPLTVIASVPLALLGTAFALLALHVASNLYTQIGLILLIALSSKNAILIVEFARELRIREGRGIASAAIEAARARFRPILMTSFAFILGVVPLVLSSGAGANAQKSIGIAVLTGMLGSTLLTVVFAPSVFVIMQRFEEARRRDKGPARKSTAA
ncbi:efflux RND transporter permease subunit [Methylocapsa palsarum]|uniref:Efflux pump membrane transporter n=1 Tax=Methylocapsa palsarum TaxID=1612308 RepID=A0A1I4C4I1_9HYPH|nr:efflux RND transporter permease subunit [Methylocapsa palsarum]SFK75297.1 hydrophobic/amphiphilic exporter-1, HAE1 family [Methylocapsa palsarum]